MAYGPLGASALGDQSITVGNDITIGDDLVVTDTVTAANAIFTTSGTLGTSAGSFAFTGVQGSGAAAGSALTYIAGAGGATSGNGGAMTCRGGNGTAGNGAGGAFTSRGGDGQGSGGGGNTTHRGGDGGATGAGGSGTFAGGAGGATSGNGGSAELRGGLPVDGNGGSALVTGRAGVGTDRSGGDVTITAGAATGTGVPGIITLVGMTGLNAPLSPSTLASGSTDNYNPTGFNSCNVLRVTPDAGGTSVLSGMVPADTSGRVVLLMNIGAANLTLDHDAVSTAANRFLCPNSVDLVIPPNGSRFCWYDTTSSRWRVLGAVAWWCGPHTRCPSTTVPAFRRSRLPWGRGRSTRTPAPSTSCDRADGRRSAREEA